MLNEHEQRFSALLPGQSTEAGTTRRTALKAALGCGLCRFGVAHDGADGHQHPIRRPDGGRGDD
jgi:hypothetical protein